VHCAFVPSTPHPTFMGFGCARMESQGVQSFYNAIRLIVLMVFFSSEQVHLIVPLGWSFSWSFSQVNKFMSLLSSSFNHFLHCCVWSSPSHLLVVLCVVVLFPPFMGVGCARMELQGMWNICNIMKLIVLMVFFCSPHCHCLFWIIYHVNVHGHILIICLHYCALQSCSPFSWGLGV